ncbi:hypothetical protein PK52_gp24 [Geobacillus phage vB_GthS_PK5.2]|nr:hypothetical protein PK52_gp24 [Geobacillus phage vB_GthS_PK5.2]
MFRQKVERVGTIQEFLHKEKGCAKSAYPFKVAATIAGGTILFTLTGFDTAHAAELSGAIYDKITTAFMPVVELIKGLAYPISLIVMTGGAIMIMIGSKEKGYSMIQNAGIGYILVQMVPLLMNLLVEIAKSL